VSGPRTPIIANKKYFWGREKVEATGTKRLPLYTAAVLLRK